MVVELEPRQGHVLEVAEANAGNVDPAAGRSGIARHAKGLRPTRRQDFLQGIRAWADIWNRVVPIGVRGSAIHPVERDVPAGQSLVASILEAIAVAVVEC